MSFKKASLMLLVAALGIAAAACSLVIGNFHECDDANPCEGGLLCIQNACVGETLPPGCRGIPDAGIPLTYGSDAGNVINVGVIVPLTNLDGTRNARSYYNWQAIKLAVDEINGRNGVGGRQFALITCDTESVTSNVQPQIDWLADSRKSPATIVFTSTAVLAGANPAVSKNMLLISPSATSKEVTAISDKRPGGSVGLVWRTAPSDEFQARVIAEILKGSSAIGADAGFAGLNRVGVLYVDETYGQGLSQLMADKLAGAKTLQSALFKRGDETSYPNALNQLNTFDPDITVLISFTDDAPKILNAARIYPKLLKPGHQWFFTDSVKDPKLLNLDGGLGEIDKALGTAPAQNAGGGYSVFAGRFTSANKVDPVQYSFTAHSYDAMYCVAMGAAWAVGKNGDGEVTGERIATGLTHVSDPSFTPVYRFQSGEFTQAASALQQGMSINVSGASGELDFDPATGEAPSAFEVWQVRGSTIQTVGTVNPPP